MFTSTNYGFWSYWSIYDTSQELFGNQKVKFDGINKLIIVHPDVTELSFREDVYSGWKEWVEDPHHQNAQYEEAISVVGGDSLPGDRSLGTTYFLENGWRMRTWEGDHELTVTGNFFTREGVPAFVNTLDSWTITINLNTSTLVETIFGQTNITAGDIASIATGVWADSVATQLIADITSIPDNVWDEIIDNTKNQTARVKLRKIASKTQDIALT